MMASMNGRNFQWQHRWSVAAIVGLHVITARGAGDEINATIADLKKQIQALSEKVNDLEFQQMAAGYQQQKTNTDESKQNSAPFITAGAEGFSLQSPDTNFVLRLHGYGQFDGHYYASAAPARDEFTIRRLRMIASGEVYHDFDYFIQTDFGSGTTSSSTNNAFLQDAYVNIHYFEPFQVQAGKMKPPLSLEWVPADEYLWFVERGFPSELAPNRDVGIMVHGDVFNGSLNYYAGAYDGVPDGGSGDANVADNDKDVVARVFALPFKNTSFQPLQKFGLGLGGSYGLQPGDATPTFTTVGRQTFFKYNSTVSEGGEHLRINPQAYYFWGPFGAYGEYILSDTKFQIATRPQGSANFQDSAWDIVGCWFLTGENAAWAAMPDVARPLRFRQFGRGAVQLVARFGQIALDPASIALGYAAPGSAQGATSWSVGLNWYLNRNIKCILEYSQTTFDGGSKAPGTVTGQNEQALLGRLQFGF